MLSPCVARCGLNDDNYCMGCYRHIDEIVGWGQADESRQQAIISALAERKQKYEGMVNQKTLNREQWLASESRIANHSNKSKN
ncbi:DUF1289 domain-containing protein [Shewanella gelidii]|uniref:DUF1289 domain-containing protein n=1 Tax=Shewanella gelidii TaxID=1642821 RepID=A0A917JN65_9GAMM|nr:DUF1289 domain-containing protein [Shewanella gelidii]MCL1097415.1 DUF1289 domain-containing protein [Shewanella gelidii]GGI74975.1 DUF1289 domain-containing protein [Shewanella gelidii]